jgi:tetratricopeptide (TPR) repeat protein
LNSPNPKHSVSDKSAWRTVERAGLLVTIAASAGSLWQAFNTPSDTNWLIAAGVVAVMILVAWVWFAKDSGNKILLPSDEPNKTPRFPKLRRYLLASFVMVILVGSGKIYWQWQSAKPKPGVFRVLITDLDQDCDIKPKAPLKSRIRKELQDQAAKVGASLEVVMLPDPLRADETRESALVLLKENHGHILIWGNYHCTRELAEMHIRAEWKIDGVDLKVGREARQATLAELDSLALPKLEAKSIAGLVFLVLALSEYERSSWAAVEKLNVQAAESLREAIRSESAVPRESEMRLAGAAYLMAGWARYRLGNLDGAARAFEDAAGVRPAFHEAFTNWGSALSELAARKQELREAETLWRQAFEKYAAASRIKPGDHIAFYGWGLALQESARRKSGQAGEDDLQQALDKYREAVRLKPKDYAALNNWGNALYEMAWRKSGRREEDDLWRQAFEKYDQAIQLKPRHHVAFHNWGLALAVLATRRQDPERNQLLAEAAEKFRQAEALSPSNATYRLACVSSLRGRPLEAKQSVEEAIRLRTLPERRILEKDEALDPIRNEPWFAAILAQAK